MMDDSDLDFSDLCSRLLKRRVRKKAGETGEDKKSGDRDGETQSSSTAPSCSKQRKKSNNHPKKRTKKDASSEPLGKVESEPRAVLQAVSVAQLTESGTERQSLTQLTSTQKSKVDVKEVVLSRMQRFKRVDPQKLQHADSFPSTVAEPASIRPPSPPVQTKELSLDERLAVRLQKELDKEFEGQAQGKVVNVDQGGLFFCQLCFRDLSAMTPQLRTQHINRCLDQSESQAAPAPVAPRPVVPECPICGKGFKSLKSRSTHLKRCSAEMGVPPAVLLQAVQRQASEAVSDSTASQSVQAGGPKRRLPSDPTQPARKRPKKATQPVDEDTMVALALSRSLLDQEVEMERAKAVEVMEVKGAEPQMSVGATLQWKPGAAAGKGRRRRKGAPAGPPPLLLRQDPEEALRRLQERVSLMLLRSRTPSPPPTPTLPPSSLLPPPQRYRRGHAEGESPDPCSSAPLWHKSALPAGSGHATAEFYTAELSAFIQPYASPQRDQSSSTMTPPVKVPPAPPSQPSAAAPTAQVEARPPSPNSPTPSPVLPSQAVQDLLALGEKGLNLAAAPDQGRSSDAAPQQLSGLTNPVSETHVEPNTSSSLSRLASDLSSMVNNPQLSDVQLQVDSGEVLFAHSFMLYARCPLLVEQVHASGFGVQEEGMPAAQRVLLGEVPAGAVLTVLQFLYSAQCPLTPSLAPHVQELAARFDLPELSQECQLYLRRLEQEEGSQAWGDAPAPEPPEGQQEQDNTQAQLHFLELLRSMWSSQDEVEEEEEGQGDGLADGEMSVRVEEQASEGEENGGEEHVDEEELEEIYEFVATQRRWGESALRHETESLEEEEEEEVEEEVEAAEEDVRMFFEMEEEKTSDHGAGEVRDRVGSRVSESIQEETPIGPGGHLNESPHTEGPSSHHKDGSGAAMETYDECTSEKDDQDGEPHPDDQDGEPHPPHPDDQNGEPHPEPVPHTDANLNDSYDQLFSQSWGEYAEPSSAPATQHQSRSKPDPVRIIDLSISPPAPTCEPSFPVPGLSPELTIARGSQRLRTSSEMTVTRGSQMATVSPELSITHASQRLRLSSKMTVTRGSQRATMSPELTVTHASQRLRMSPELTITQGSQKTTVSPQLMVTHANQRLSMSPKLTFTQGSQKTTVSREWKDAHASQRLGMSPELREKQGRRVEALPSSSQGQGSSTDQCSKEVELIVLSDSGDDSPMCLSPSPPQPVCTQSPLVLLEDSPLYTCIKDVAKAKDSLSASKTAQPLKDPCDSQSAASDPPPKAHPTPSGPESPCAADSPGVQSLLDGSAEVSWLVPSTPHISNRTRSSSTQTESSMRRTRLFPGSSSSQASSASSSSSSSSVPGHSKAPSLNNISCKEESEEVSVSDQTPTSHQAQAKLEGSRPNLTGDDSPVFLPPKSLPRRFSSAADLTPCESHRGASVDKPSSKRFGQPVSSTPLHSDLESLMCSHLLSVSPFLSNMGKSQHFQESGTAPRGSAPSDGSPERRGYLGFSHLQDVSPSSNREEARTSTSKSRSRQKDSTEVSNPGSSARSKGGSEHRPSGAEEVGMNGVKDNKETESKETGTEEEDEDEDGLPPQQSFSNYDEPAMPFDEPPMAYDDPPMAFEEQPIACDDQAAAFDEPPMAFDDSWGFGDCRADLHKPRFSLRLESSGDAGLSSTTPLGAQATVTTDRTPPAASPEPRPGTSVLDPKLWDSWEEEEGAGAALPLSQRLDAIAPAKRVAQLRTPVASKKAGPLVPITPMPHYSDLDTPDLKNKLNRFGVRPLPKRQMVQKLKEIFQYTHQLESSESDDEAPVHGYRPRPVPPPARSCAQSLKFKEPRAPPAVSPRKMQLSLDAQEPLSLSQSSNASSTDASQDSERSNPELLVSDDGDSSSDSEGPVTASQAVSRHTDKLKAVRRFILSDPELHRQVLQYRPLVLSQLQERLKAAGIRLGAAKLLDFLDAQCITFTTAKPGQKAPSRRRRKKPATAGAKGTRAAAEGGARGRGGRKRGGGARAPD
ncbi:structure-specific endonuclease subunit SLX4 [Alosa pseudoharengus]|uniref:structure-specific endonuclease subunit SLX4 n=1 Tax=Alosa pseudoharengus TaxID=34774 RepID=UPI003F8B7FC9